jgi:hypothetical protein
MKRRYELPDFGNVSLTQLTGNSNRPGIIPFGPREVRQMVRAGVFPPPIKLPNRHVAWRAEDVRAWMLRGGK